MNQWAWLVVAGCITFLMLGGLHWMPQRKPLGRIGRYVGGVACLFVGFCIWRLPLGDWQTPLGLAIIIAAGGVAVIGAYEWDEITKDRRKVEKVESTDEGLH